MRLQGFAHCPDTALQTVIENPLLEALIGNIPRLSATWASSLCHDSAILPVTQHKGKPLELHRIATSCDTHLHTGMYKLHLRMTSYCSICIRLCIIIVSEANLAL